jgi:hypothetical protein
MRSFLRIISLLCVLALPAMAESQVVVTTEDIPIKKAL